jgi:hypothetical protein
MVEEEEEVRRRRDIQGRLIDGEEREREMRRRDCHTAVTQSDTYR